MVCVTLAELTAPALIKSASAYHMHPDTAAIIVFGSIAAISLSFPLRAWLRRRRRRNWRAQPAPQSWRTILQAHMPLYRRMPQGLREELLSDMQVFLAEKRFIGCDGLEVTDLMRILVAAHACMLQLNLQRKFFPSFTSILIYPDTFVATEEVSDGTVVSSHAHARAGESWHRGPLVLSWSDAIEGVVGPYDGQNVILHEFAHKLDEQDGAVDGAPNPASGTAWNAVFSREFKQLRAELEAGRQTFLDPYAATAPAEFFAVCVETFFEQGQPLRARHAELYALLREYFQLDPASWEDADGR